MFCLDDALNALYAKGRLSPSDQSYGRNEPMFCFIF